MIEWVQVSGDVSADAAYLASLYGMKNGVALRQRELKRLASLYGAGYRMNVEKALADRDAPDGAMRADAGPVMSRQDAMQAAREILGRR